MHAGLAALAESEQSASKIGALVARVKSLASNREAVRLALGKQLILGRSFFSPTAFSKPESREVWLQRVRANFGHYRSLCAPHRLKTDPASQLPTQHSLLQTP